MVYNNHKFSRSSLVNMSECHEDLQLIMKTALKMCRIDFGISCGHRSVEDQQKAFNDGKSDKDGINNKSKHNYIPSLAVDVYVYVAGKKELAYDELNLSYIAGVIITTANILHAQGVIEHKIRWGGNWNMDGEILTDQGFDDMPHFELYKEE